MVAISFKPEWREKLLSGEKSQTIRPFDIDEELWKEMEKKAVDRSGLYGAIKKAINEAIRE